MLSRAGVGNAIALWLYLLGIAFCVNGFIIRKYSQLKHPSLLPTMSGSRAPSLVLPQATQQDVLYEGDNANMIYPTDTLMNIGLNTTISLAPDIAYFYLQNTLGLSEETMWKITLEAGSILGMTPRNLEKKVSLLRRTMNLSDEDVRIILGKQPAVLHYSADKNLAPTILFLVRALDLSKSELRTMIVDCPSILGYSLENLGKKIAFFRSMEYPDMDQLRQLLVGTPKLLLSAVDTGLVPRMRFLLNEIRFSLEELRNLYLKNPRLLLMSVDDNLREKIVFFFILQLQLETVQVRKILRSFPQVMDYNLENHMKPISRYFMTELEFSASEMGSMVLKFPRLFSYSLHKIKHVTGFLRFELELNPRQAKRVIFQAPQVLGLNTEGNVREKLDFLRDRLDLTNEELNQIFSAFPTLICLGIETTVGPKLNYLESILLDEDQPDHFLKDTILKQPSMLGYSLEGRIQPRMQRLIAAGLSPNKITVGISMTEDKFQQWLLSSQLRIEKCSIAAEQIVTVSDVLIKDLKFTREDLNTLYSGLPEMNDWNVPALQSWISHLKGELGVPGTELKSMLLSYPLLLDSSSCRKLRSRLKKLHSADISVRENLNTIDLSDNDFEGWMRISTSKLSYLQRRLRLNATEINVILSEIPSLETVKTNKVFQQKINHFMAELGNSTEDVKCMLLGQPSYLNLPMKQIATMSIEDGQICMEILQTMLHFTQKEIDSIAEGNKGPMRQNVELKLASKIDYLLTQGSEEDIKNAILSRPKMLSYSLEKLQNMSHVLASGRSKVTRYHFRNESGAVLRDMLGLSEEDIEIVLSRTHYLLLRDPKDFLAPKLNYLISEFGGHKKQVISCVMINPGLLDNSLDEWIIPRMELLTGAGLDPSQINDMVSISQSDVDERMNLQNHLNLTETELDHILPMKVWLVQRRLRRGAGCTTQYLTSQLNDSISAVKQTLLKEPKLLTLSLSKTIQPRMLMLLDSGCPPTDICEVALLSERKADEYCSKCYLCRILGLSSHQMDHLLSSVGATRTSPSSMRKTVHFLLHHVFKGSNQLLRATILEKPALMKQSLEHTIQPRVEVLNDLKSIGLDYGSSEITDALMISNSDFAKELAPKAETWDPPFSDELVKKQKEGDSHNEVVTNKNDILASLKDIPRTLALAYSDEPNRDGARVVHWK